MAIPSRQRTALEFPWGRSSIGAQPAIWTRPPDEPNAEIDAIAGVVRDGMAALTQRDFEAWARTWVQDGRARRIGQRDYDAAGIGPCAGLIVQDGWENIAPAMLQLMNDKSVAIDAKGKHCTNWYTRISGDTAWVTFDQYPVDATGNPAPETLGFMREARVLERHSNEWKFTYMSFFQEVPQRVAEATVRVDEDAAIVGMTRAAAERIGESEALRVGNGRLRAVDKDVDKRLLAAIREAASVAPWTDVGSPRIPFLVKTPWGVSDCVCWIGSSVDMVGSVVIAIGDALGSRSRLHNAILVYRLSPAQARLAHMLLNGNDLASAADQLGVTINTARTHLHRMFEKTGVRSQPALVTALLSVLSPL